MVVAELVSDNDIKTTEDLTGKLLNDQAGDAVFEWSVMMETLYLRERNVENFSLPLSNHLATAGEERDNVLESKAEIEGLSNKIAPLCCSMDSLPFEDEEFDVIWSEGAVYNIGFNKGVIDWNRYLKPGGLLVASEMSWITNTRPSEIQKHWESEYPEIDVASAKMSILEKKGYSPIGYFDLPEHCWLDNYYRPMQDRFRDFLERNGNSEEARTIVEAETREIELYEKYKSHYSYGVYIARNLD